MPTEMSDADIREEIKRREIEIYSDKQILLNLSMKMQDDANYHRLLEIQINDNAKQIDDLESVLKMREGAKFEETKNVGALAGCEG